MSELLPYNATPAENALEESIARISDTPTPVRTVWNADTCAANLLPWLAWAVSVDEWSANWSDLQKREAIKRSVSVHRYKGTIGAVREAVAALGLDCVVQEWFAQDPEGAPYTFRLILNTDQAPATEQQLEKLVAVVNSSKNLRSHLDTVVPGSTTVNNLFVGGAILMGNEITVGFAGNLLSDGTAISDGHYKSNSLKLD